MPCTLDVSYDDWLQIKQCEAVIIREYEFGGKRFAQAVAWGDLSEMEDQASTPGMFIVPTGVSIIAQKAILVADILLPENLGC